MTAGRYARAGRRWAHGATLVYGPIAAELVAMSPHPLARRTVLDAGAGTGAASSALAAAGARAVAMDLSFGMLAWNARARPPCVAADIRALPLPARSVGDTVAAFVLNHLAAPAAGLAELVRVTRSGGAALAAVFSNASRSQARDRVDAVAQDAGWQVPDWYLELKAAATPVLGTANAMSAAARAAGLADIAVPTAIEDASGVSAARHGHRVFLEDARSVLECWCQPSHARTGAHRISSGKPSSLTLTAWPVAIDPPAG